MKLEDMGNIVIDCGKDGSVELGVVKHGHWIYEEYSVKKRRWICSRCGKPFRGNFTLSENPAAYCQYCGSKNSC